MELAVRIVEVVTGGRSNLEFQRRMYRIFDRPMMKGY